MLERFAEQLTAHQVELIAQIEGHLRAVHHTMRRIETLRTVRQRVGRELSNGERRDVLARLADEVAAIERQLETEEDTCRAMHVIIRRMQEGMGDLRLITRRPTTVARNDTSEQA